MKCPNCNETLLMTERNNIEIDYCPSCRGVWLDKGELDKFIEFASQNTGFQQPQQQVYPQPQAPRYQDPKPQYPNHHQKPYKKKSIFGELFDFD